MTTEEKIREAFDNMPMGSNQPRYYEMYRAGYLALLNSLELVGSNKVEMLYRLPKGVTKDVS